MVQKKVAVNKVGEIIYLQFYFKKLFSIKNFMLHVYQPEFYGSRLQYFIASPVVSLTCTFHFYGNRGLRNQCFTINSNSF